MEEEGISRCGCCEPSEEMVFPGGAAFAPPPEVLATVTETGDAPADDSTTESMEVGDIFNGSIGVTGDEDWIAVDLEAGETISFMLDATFFGGAIEVYDDEGNLVASATGGFGTDPEAVLDVLESGTYYVAVSHNNGTRTGDYTLSVDTYVPPSPLDALDWGGQTVDMGGDTVINVYFALNGETWDGITAEGMNAYEISRFEEAFELYSSIIGVQFNIVFSSASADFIMVGDDGGQTAGFYGYFNPPGERNEGIGAFNTGLWDRVAGGDLEYGGFGFITIMHELGHAMGLAHPHDTGGGSPVMEGVTSSQGSYGIYDLNQGVYTMMSYNDGASVLAPASSQDWGYQATMMALDIALLQEKYGANMDTATGDDTYEITDLEGAGQAWACIWDAGGTDEVVYNGSGNGIIDLREATLEYEEGGGGFISHVNGVAGGYTIAAGATIENGSGGSNDDWIIGNMVANTLTGNGGDDELRSFAGNDVLIGGGGNDLFFAGKGADEVTGGAGIDTLVIRQAFEAGVGAGERDVFTDFTVGVDVIDLSRADADAGTAGDQEFIFIAAAAFSGGGVGEVQVTDQGAFDLVQVDFDGDGNADLAIELFADGAVTESDFIL